MDNKNLNRKFRTQQQNQINLVLLETAAQGNCTTVGGVAAQIFLFLKKLKGKCNSERIVLKIDRNWV